MLCRPGDCYNRRRMGARTRFSRPGCWLRWSLRRSRAAHRPVPADPIGITSDYVCGACPRAGARARSRRTCTGTSRADGQRVCGPRRSNYQPQQESHGARRLPAMARLARYDLDFAATATHYSYPGDPRPVSYNYDELSAVAAVARPVRVAASWTPSLNLYSYSDGLATDRQVYTLEASWHRDLPRRLDLSAGCRLLRSHRALNTPPTPTGTLTLGWKYGHWRVNLAWIWVQDTDTASIPPARPGGRWRPPCPGFSDRC